MSHTEIIIKPAHVGGGSFNIDLDNGFTGV